MTLQRSPARTSRSRFQILCVLGLLAGLSACDNLLGNADKTPLTGLQYAASQDSAGNDPPPVPLGAPSPGYFQGTVLGPSESGSGGDTLATAPRVAGAVLKAYTLPASGTIDSGVLGDPVQTVTTGADGRFAFLPMGGGNYAVTITPPAGSLYGGVWVTATAHASSHTFPWWVVLWKK